LTWGFSDEAMLEGRENSSSNGARMGAWIFLKKRREGEEINS